VTPRKGRTCGPTIFDIADTPSTTFASSFNWEQVHLACQFGSSPKSLEVLENEKMSKLEWSLRVNRSAYLQTLVSILTDKPWDAPRNTIVVKLLASPFLPRTQSGRFQSGKSFLPSITSAAHAPR
jgi:hypothetical protein